MLTYKISTFLVAFCFVAPCNVDAANILVYLPIPFVSHCKPFQPLFVALATRGHNVTVLSNFPGDSQVNGYNHIQTDNVIEFKKDGYAFLREQNRLENYVFVANAWHNFVEQCFKDSKLQNILHSEFKYDLVMVELHHMDTFMALGSNFQAPVIGLSFQPLHPVYNWLIKNPVDFSYIPHLYVPFSDSMNFYERLINTVFGIFTNLFYRFVSLPMFQSHTEALLRSINVKKASNIEEISKNVSLVLVESHFSVDYPRPYLPSVVPVAGIHIPPPKPLPKIIKDFMDNAENGIIYVSMGTMINPNLMNDFGEKLISVFQKLSHKVVWKWNPDFISNNNNILASNWLPQADILRHPKTKLFISHGGYHSILESVNGGVPILCMPFFTDQYHTTAMVEKYGFGLKEELEVTEQNLLAKIQELLFNKKYVENAKKQSGVFNDRPTSPLNLALYWTEYVIRHRGAPHLKSAAVHLPWYEYYLLDVVGVMALVVILAVFMVKRSFRCAYKMLNYKNIDEIEKK